MTEENFLRYRLEVARLMPEGAYKTAVIAAIRASLAALGATNASTRARVVTIGHS